MDMWLASSAVSGSVCGRTLLKDRFTRTPVLSKEIGGTLLEKDQAPAFQRRKPRPRRLSDFPKPHILQAQAASCGRPWVRETLERVQGRQESWRGLGGPVPGIDIAFPAQWAAAEGFYSGACQDLTHVFKYKDHVAAWRRKATYRL